MADKHILKIVGQYDHIKQICDFILAGAAQVGLDDDDIFKIELACDEACTNIIEHAYGAEGVGEITATWEADAQTFTIMLHDNGRSFDPNQVENPAIVAIDTEPEDLKIGGLGIHFIRNLMDEVRYQFDETQGNTLIMVKHIKPPSMNEQLNIWQEQYPHGIWLVGVRGRLDQSLMPQLNETLTDLLENGRYYLMVDLSGVTFINSGGLRCLVIAWRKARGEEGDVVLFGLNDHILNVFTMAGFNKVFRIVTNSLEAQNALQEPT